MQPKSLSATALQVADLCLARYHAEHILRARTPGKSAATLGSAVHGALELYVKACYIEKSHEPTPLFLAELYRMSYMAEFGTADLEDETFIDGMNMLTTWYNRTDFSGITVLSAEVKESFPIPTSIGEIPYNYIWDRFDRLDDTTVRVVDYKTNRWGLRPEDLKKKVQARCYGLAAAIKAKQQGMQVERIWVTFDLLRHDSVGIVYTREELAATWKFIKETAERIIAQPDDDLPETLNHECLFCVRLTSCEALLANIAGGGILGLDFDSAINKRAALANQAKAVAKALEQLDEMILETAKQKDIIEYETDMSKLEFKISSRRNVDAERVLQVIGQDLFHKWGGLKITMGDFDKLLKSKDVSDAQKAQLKGLVYKSHGEPTVDTKPLNPIDED